MRNVAAAIRAGINPLPRIYQFAREFSLTEGAARRTRGHLGPGGRDQLGFVEGSMVLELGRRPGIQVRMTGS